MKIKFGIKSIVKYIYVVVIMINIFLIYSMFNFIQINILGAINPKDALLHFQDRKYSENLNIKKFDEIIKKIKQKKNNTVVPVFENIENQKISTSSSNSF